MAINMSKTEIIGDSIIPSRGDGFSTRLSRDNITMEEVYAHDVYSPTNGSWCGCKFGVDGASVGGSPSRPEGVIFSAKMELYLYPFVINQFSRFPMTQDDMVSAWVKVSGGSLTKTVSTATFIGDGAYNPNQVVHIETIDNIQGSIGICGLYVEKNDAGDDVVVPRLLGETINTGRLDVEGAIDIIDQAKLMQANSLGNCIGFTWTLLPNISNVSVSGAVGGTKSILRTLFGTSNVFINEAGYYEGTAECTFITWQNGYSISSGAVRLNNLNFSKYHLGPTPHSQI